MDKFITEKFSKFIQELNSVAPCDLFINIALNLLRKIESLSRCDDNLDIQLKRLSKLLDKVTLDFSQIHLQINQLYWEIVVYYYLKYKNGICVKKVQENDGTPDYEINFKGQLFALEVKTPVMADALTKYKEYQESALNAKIQAEEEAKKKKVGFSVRIIQPYLKSKNKSQYYPDSPKFVIETLIEKIEQNFKPKQFKAKYSKRILCVVLDQLPLLSKPIESSVPVYPCFYSKSCVSGELWHVAFGKKGILILKPAEFEGKGNIDGVLGKDGVLIEKETFIDALIFVIPELNKKISFVGFYKVKDNQGKYLDNKILEEFLFNSCEFVNNELNENNYYYTLFEQK